MLSYLQVALESSHDFLHYRILPKFVAALLRFHPQEEIFSHEQRRDVLLALQLTAFEFALDFPAFLWSTPILFY